MKEENHQTQDTVKSEGPPSQVKTEGPREVFSFELGRLSGDQSAGPRSIATSNRGPELTQVNMYGNFGAN